MAAIHPFRLQVGGADGARPLNLPTVQWAIGPDSAFHWSALGLLPYKDTFFSNTSEMTESKESRFVDFTESNPLTHALMATLSMAQVTFSDGIGMTNKTLVMMICRDDGVILKADRPATAIDAQFNAMMFGGWPGPVAPSPSPPPAPANPARDIVLKPCDTSALTQQWDFTLAASTTAAAAGSSSGTLSIASSKDSACMDVSSCRTSAGNAVHMFSDPTGARCGAKSICKGKNEKFELQDGNIAAVELAPGMGMCVAVTSGGKPATLEQCGSSPLFKFPTAWPGLIQSASDPSMCLQGGQPHADPAAASFSDMMAIETEGFTPTDWEANGFSHNYAGALRISEELLYVAIADVDLPLRLMLFVLPLMDRMVWWISFGRSPLPLSWLIGLMLNQKCARLP